MMLKTEDPRRRRTGPMRLACPEAVVGRRAGARRVALAAKRLRHARPDALYAACPDVSMTSVDHLDPERLARKILDLSQESRTNFGSVT